MIEFIKNKLGENLVCIEQEKYNNEYVDSYVLEYRINDSVEFTFIWLNSMWHCSSDHFVHTIYADSLDSLLDKLKSEI